MDITKAAVMLNGGSEMVLGRRGVWTFRTQQEAEHFLFVLPENYWGRTAKTDSGWMVSFRYTPEAK